MSHPKWLFQLFSIPFKWSKFEHPYGISQMDLTYILLFPIVSAGIIKNRK